MTHGERQWSAMVSTGIHIMAQFFPSEYRSELYSPLGGVLRMKRSKLSQYWQPKVSF